MTRRLDRSAIGVAAAALIIAVLGTTPVGQAATNLILPKKSVGAVQLKRNAVTAAKVKDHSLRAADFGAGQLPAGPKGDPGTAGPQGPQGATGPTGPRGPSDAYVKTSQSPVVVVPALTTKTVATLDIPKPGKYVVTAKAVVFSTAGADIVCSLGPSGSAVDVSRITLADSGIDTLANQMAIDYTAPGSVMYRCSANKDTNAHWIAITATRVDSLSSS
jgi:hypothetical protein